MATLGRYRVGEIIGRGEFATVKLGEHVETGRKVAMKFLDKNRLNKDPQGHQRVQNEICNQQGLNHEHVIKIEDVIETDEELCIVLEYAPGGDLFDYIVRHIRLKEDEALRIFRQLINGIDHCHQHMVVHRDLKPENIMMDRDFNLKIADFGLSAVWMLDDFLTDSCGSPNYAAPELLYKGCKYEGPEIDIWSCGVVLYTLLCGCLPFDDDSIPNLFKKIKAARYTLPGYLSSSVKDLLTRMLTVDSKERIRIEEIRAHPWFKEEEQVTSAPCTPSSQSATVDAPDQSSEPSIFPASASSDSKCKAAAPRDSETTPDESQCQQLAKENISASAAGQISAPIVSKEAHVTEKKFSSHVALPNERCRPASKSASHLPSYSDRCGYPADSYGQYPMSRSKSAAEPRFVVA